MAAEASVVDDEDLSQENHENTKITKTHEEDNMRIFLLRVLRVLRVFVVAFHYGSTAVIFRFGTWPTGICVISFRASMSITETELDPALAT